MSGFYDSFTREGTTVADENMCSAKVTFEWLSSLQIHKSCSGRTTRGDTEKKETV